MKNNFFIDSTVWIEFFRGKNKAVCELVSGLIDDGGIFCNGVIISELLIGALNEKEFNLLNDNFEGLEFLETDKETFQIASHIGFRLKRHGLSAPLTDIVIAAHCIKHNLILITSDAHFKMINEKTKLKIKFVK